MHTHGRAGLRSQNAIDWPRPTTNVEERLLHSPEVVAGRAATMFMIPTENVTRGKLNRTK